MLTLSYTGPKPLISQHGIYFKKGKEDKYVYLKLATKILLFIDKDYSTKKHYEIYIDNHEKMPDDEILDILKTYEPKLEAHIKSEILVYEEHINNMISEVRELTISDEEQDTWIENINIMRKYLIQREVNKLYYIHCIKAIKRIIYNDKIAEIDINFTINHWHILESIAGNLEYGAKSIHTEIVVRPDSDGTLMARLLINPNH